MQEKREEVRFAVRECDELGELYMRFARSDAAAAASPSRTTWSARFYVERIDAVRALLRSLAEGACA